MDDRLPVNSLSQHPGAAEGAFDLTRSTETLAILQDLLDAMDEGAALWDHDLKFILCNTRYRELILPKGFREMRIGECARAFGVEAFASGFFVLPDEITPEEVADRVVETVRAFIPDLELLRTDGRVLKTASKPTRLGGYLITVKDITDERNTDLKARDMLFESFQSLDEGMILCDSDMRFVFANEAWKRMTFDGVDVDPPQPGDNVLENLVELVGAGFYDIPDGMSQADYVNWIMKGMAEHGKQVAYRSADGRHFIGSSHLTSYGGALLFVRDVTKQHLAEEQARETLLDAMQALDEGLVLYDSDLRFVHANAAWYDMFYGLARPRPKVGDHARDLALRDLADGTFVVPDGVTGQEAIENYMALTKAHTKGLPVALTDGRQLIASSHETKLDGYLVSFTDVTEMRASEERIRASLLDAIEALDTSVALIDSEGGFVFANQAWHDMWMPGGPRPAEGDRPEQIIQRQLQLYPDMFDKPVGITDQDFAASLAELYTGQPKKHVMPTGDGRIILGSSHKTQRDGFLLTFEDVTDTRRAEERLLSSITAALQSLTDGIALFDADFRFIVGNDRYLEMWYPEGVDAPAPGEHVSDLARRVMKSGHMIVPHGMTMDEASDNLLRQAKGFAKNVRLQSRDGHFIANAHQTSLGGYLLEFTDVTERLQAEAELAESREIAHRNEKLSALGELLAGVAHELNNPLSVVFGYSQMLQGKVDDPVIGERIDLICQSAERAAKIVKTFLAMARQRPTKIEACSINEIVATALEVSSYSLKSNGTEVLTQFDERAPLIRGDFDQLAQVFSNLIINAGHAVEPQREAGQIVVKSFHDAARDETVVEIRDNGPGIPEAIQTRIFEPFFTTKEVGEGTGVGLAFSHRIVTSHDGALTLASTPGRGTSFFVRLQAVREAAQAPTTLNLTRGATVAQTVLVLDDEEGVAQLVCDLLSDEGLQVTKMTNPREALRLITAQTFDAVISDFKMPDMDGQAFFDAVQVIAPKLAKRIGFMTGDAMSKNVRDFFERSGCPHIEKPIVKGEIMAMLEMISKTSEATQ